jgi:predicted ribosome quality control (RQC) complex YloA/Tae2 family protein
MHRNYFLFHQQIKYLNTLLQDYMIISSFTHRKDELVLHIDGDDDFFLRISVNKRLPYVILNRSYNIKEHHVNLFPEIERATIHQFSIQPFDKRLKIQCNIWYLDCTFYGSTPNIILRDEAGNNVNRFKKYKIMISEQTSETKINPYLSRSDQILKFASRHPDIRSENFFAHYIDGFNTVLAREICSRCDIPADLKLHGLDTDLIDRIIKQIKQIVHEMDQGMALLYKHGEKSLILSIIKLNHLRDTYDVERIGTLNEAWKKFVNYHQYVARFTNLKLKAGRALDQRIAFLEKSLKHIAESKNIEAKKKTAEMKGNLLLTYAEQIPKGVELISLENIFSEAKNKIEIRLNPAKSAKQNAQSYFNKYNDIPRTKNQIRVRERTYRKELSECVQLDQRIKNVKSLKDIQKIEQLLIDKKIMQGQSGEKANKAIPEAFKRAVLEGGWEVYIGRNARNNDQLTFQFARKSDLWLHAQGIKGSHTVLRLIQKDTQPPRQILEQAAQIAAYHSAAKNDSTVPVIYTPVRYVRKSRKALAGQVTVIQSKTIFVTPKNLI